MIDVTQNNIAELIVGGESEQIEFKESFNDEAIETIGAFSNAQGGIVLLGVKDSGAVCGFQVGKKTLEDIANRIQAATDPRLQPSLSVIRYQNLDILVIRVFDGTGLPISVRGRFYKRSGRTNQRMSHEEIMRRMILSSGLSWDAVVEPGASLDDLDQNLVARFIEAVKKLGRRPVPEFASPEEFLSKIELIQGNKPTRAALLLFGKNTNSYYPSAFLKMGRFRSPTMIVDDREAHGALIEQLDQAMGWFRERLETEFAIKGKLERDVRWEYPLSAIREAIINMLCHRDYTSAAHSQVRLFDNYLEVRNVGGLLAPLTPESLLREHDSIPRNRKIAEVFFYMGLIERWGSGTLRIAEELEKAGLPPPEFISEAGVFKLIITKQPILQALSERQLKIVEYLRKNETISNAQYQEVVGVSKRTATREIVELLSKNVLSTSGGERGPGKVYFLKTD